MRWSNWRFVRELSARDGRHPHFPGINQIRMVTSRGAPIIVVRIGGADPDGILYIGCAAVRRTRTHRCVEVRIRHSPQGVLHSGGYTYSKARRGLRRHALQFRTLRVARSKVGKAEERALMVYFKKFGELPPYNGSFPGR